MIIDTIGPFFIRHIFFFLSVRPLLAQCFLTSLAMPISISTSKACFSDKPPDWGSEKEKRQRYLYSLCWYHALRNGSSFSIYRFALLLYESFLITLMITYFKNVAHAREVSVFICGFSRTHQFCVVFRELSSFFRNDFDGGKLI